MHAWNYSDKDTHETKVMTKGMHEAIITEDIKNPRT